MAYNFRGFGARGRVVFSPNQAVWQANQPTITQVAFTSSSPSTEVEVSANTDSILEVTLDEDLVGIITIEGESYEIEDNSGTVVFASGQPEEYTFSGPNDFTTVSGVTTGNDYQVLYLGQGSIKYQVRASRFISVPRPAPSDIESQPDWTVWNGSKDGAETETDFFIDNLNYNDYYYSIDSVTSDRAVMAAHLSSTSNFRIMGVNLNGNTAEFIETNILRNGEAQVGGLGNNYFAVGYNTGSDSAMTVYKYDGTGITTQIITESLFGFGNYCYLTTSKPLSLIGVYWQKSSGGGRTYKWNESTEAVTLEENGDVVIYYDFSYTGDGDPVVGAGPNNNPSFFNIAYAGQRGSDVSYPLNWNRGSGKPDPQEWKTTGMTDQYGNALLGIAYRGSNGKGYFASSQAITDEDVIAWRWSHEVHSDTNVDSVSVENLADDLKMVLVATTNDGVWAYVIQHDAWTHTTVSSQQISNRAVQSVRSTLMGAYDNKVLVIMPDTNANDYKVHYKVLRGDA